MKDDPKTLTNGTVTSEAFAVLLFANCRDKWVADYEFIEKNPKASIPQHDKTNPETWKHQNKWSSSRTGQVIGGGWATEGLNYFNDMVTAVGQTREKEQLEGFTKYKLIQDMIRVAHSVKLDEPAPNNGKNKRKRGDDSAAEQAPPVVDLIFLDE